MTKLPRINTSRHPDDETAILELMADGKERTANDVAVRLSIPRRVAVHRLHKMAYANRIVSDDLAGASVYRLPGMARKSVDARMEKDAQSAGAA